VPEALCTGVMERVLSEDLITTTEAFTSANATSRKPIRLTLWRYAPIAACLAIMLIALPWIIDSFSRLSFDTLAPETSALRGADIPMDEIVGYYAAIEESNLDTGAGVKTADDAPFSIHDDAYDGDFQTPQFEQALPAPVDAPVVAPGAECGEEQQGEADEAEMDRSRQAAGSMFEFRSYYSDAYAFIEINGELPEFLKSYDPQPLDNWHDWDKYYILPRAAAQQLIGLIGECEGVMVIENYDNSNYAVVLYSSGA